MQAAVGAFVRVGGVLTATIMMLASALIMPAHAQDPYPPPPPPPPPPQAAVECQLESQGRTVTCEGEGFQPGSTVTLQLHRQGPPGNASGGNSGGNVVATGQSVVGSDGTFKVSAELPCDYTNDRVRAQVRGTDARGNQRTFTQNLDVSDADRSLCGDAQVLGAGETAPRSDAADVLPLTGVQLVTLILLALGLIAAGTLLVLRRRSRHAPT